MFLGLCVRTPAAQFAVVLCGLLLGGCSAPSKLVLNQPFAPPSQQVLKLTSRWAFAARMADGYGCLLAFPRPEAPGAARDFLIYVLAPSDQGEFAMAPDGARGFLIQEVGNLSGKTLLTEGRVRLAPVWLRPHQRRLKLDAYCTDGTRVTGRALLQDAPGELKRFRRHYGADVAELMFNGQDEVRPVGATEHRPSHTP